MSEIPRRAYANTGFEISIIGFGGIVVTDEEQGMANRIVAEAVEKGVNYFDVAPGYGDAEIKLGPALEPYRKNVFLACKTGVRERAGAEEEFNRSLERLRTDYFDLYQLHGISSVEKDVDPVFEKGGVMDMLIEKQKAGQIRNIGFSTHTHEAALAALDRFNFASILMPINFATYLKGNFGKAIIDLAVERGVSLLALKAMAKQHWSDEHPDRQRFTKCWYEPIQDREEAELALRWTLSQPIVAAMPPGNADLWRMAVEIGRDFRPITPDEETRLRELAEPLNVIFEAVGS
ncbi:MAG: aldo/keto reductase [Nitrospiraceae bacterium]|nr:aldo/keto reductase [Nitrospiraceae bacterium]